MDPVTHAASGALAMLALRDRPVTLWAWPLAGLASAAPDIDLAFIRSPLEFLEIHRGISHSLAFAPIFSFILALLFVPLWSRRVKKSWRFRWVWFFCFLMILLHLWLDVVTTYGTMIFLPFSHYRVRLNSVFIVDLLLTLPLLWAVWRWRQKRGLVILALLWVFIYPGAGILFNDWHTRQWRARLADAGARVAELRVFPDVFTPLFWRVVYREEGEAPVVTEVSVDFFGDSRAEPIKRPALNKDTTEVFKKDSIEGEVFFDFAVMPVVGPLPEKFTPVDPGPDNRYQLAHDLRFGSGLAFARKIMAMRPDADIPFLFMAELKDGAAGAEIERLRLRFADSGRDSDWHKPVAPTKPSLWQWALGLRPPLN